MNRTAVLGSLALVATLSTRPATVGAAEGQPPAFDFLVPNFNHPEPAVRSLMRSQKFRQAVAHVIDRELLAELATTLTGRAFFPQASPVFVSNTVFRVEPDAPSYRLDLEEAARLLDEAGVVDTGDDDAWRELPGGEPLILRIDVNIGNLRRAAFADALSSNLRAVGLNVSPRLAPFQTLLCRLSLPDCEDVPVSEYRAFDFLILGFGMGSSIGVVPMASEFYRLPPDGPFHFWNMEGPFEPWEEELDGLVDEAECAAVDEACWANLVHRHELYTQGQALVAAQHPWFPLVTTASAGSPTASMALKDNIAGFVDPKRFGGSGGRLGGLGLPGAVQDSLVDQLLDTIEWRGPSSEIAAVFEVFIARVGEIADLLPEPSLETAAILQRAADRIIDALP
jgi:ABC-type transport system substrate-binding protein